MRKWSSKNPDKNFEQNESYDNIKDVPVLQDKNFSDEPTVGKKTGAMRGTGAAIRGTKMSQNTQ